MAPTSTSNFRPLAGRPPFATDEDDSVYNRPAQPRLPRQPADNPNQRTSAYNTYDNYLDGQPNPRDSVGAFGVGMGLMGDVSDDTDSEDDTPAHRPQKAAGKNQALFEAATRTEGAPLGSRGGPIPSTRSNPARQPPSGAARQGQDGRGLGGSDSREHRRPPGLNVTQPETSSSLQAYPSSPGFPQPSHAQRPPPSPSPIQYPPSPVPVAISRGNTQSPMPAPRAQHAPSSPARPMPAFMSPSSPVPPSPAMPTSPAGSFGQSQTLTVAIPPSPMAPMALPLLTPITPLFAAAPPSDLSKAKVKFSDDQMPIMRGGTEDALLERLPKGFKRETVGSGSGSDESNTSSLVPGPRLRSKAKEGDDFWRRFSMAGHLAEAEQRKAGNRKSTSQSSWLQKTTNGSKKFSTWVWIVGVVMLIIIGGTIGIVWYTTHDNPSHGRPTAFGGSQDEGNSSVKSSAAAATKTSSKSHGKASSTAAAVASTPSDDPNTDPQRRGALEADIFAEIHLPSITPAPFSDTASLPQVPQRPRKHRKRVLP